MRWIVNPSAKIVALLSFTALMSYFTTGVNVCKQTKEIGIGESKASSF